MRIVSLTIRKWRNLEDVYLEIPEDATLICLVGENGTGKSNILELIAMCAGQMGLSPGVQLKRHPFGAGEYDISLTLRLPEGIDLAAHQPQLDAYGAQMERWDGTLLFRQTNVINSETGAPEGPIGIRAGGFDDVNAAQHVGQVLVSALQQRQEVNELFIDADRAFNPVSIQDQEIWGLIRQDLKVPSYVRQQAALLTQNMYAEWLKAMLAGAHRYEAEYFELAQRAKRERRPIPEPEDPQEPFRAALLGVLPHLRFERLDRDNRTLVFDSAGVELRYEDLSGGEREVAFLIGQIARFQLRRGLLLIDEPELHLNPDLLRTWLSYIRASMEDGQVWIATHALEAVEAAGLDATLVLERSEDRKVRSVAPLGDRPALATLAGAVGSPAFSLARSRFILIEGERPGRERERFADLLGSDAGDKFVEVGGCNDVVRKLAAVRELAAETDQLRAGGIIDRDLRTDQQAAALASEADLHVLPCHEVENLFLHPSGVGALLEQAGRRREEAAALIREESDKHAGRWIIQYATVKEEWGDLTAEVRERGRQWTWADIAGDVDGKMRELAAAEAGVDEATRIRRKVALVSAARAYEAHRAQDRELWKRCFGKEVLRGVAPALGLSSADAVEARLVRLWDSGELPRPREVDETRAYVDGIGVE